MIGERSVLCEIASTLRRENEREPVEWKTSIVAVEERANGLWSTQLWNANQDELLNKFACFSTKFVDECFGEKTAVRVRDDSDLAGLRRCGESTECFFEFAVCENVGHG